MPLELKLDETEALSNKWVDIQDAIQFTNDMKTIFSLNLFAVIKSARK